jgi:DNA-binding MarR family transcriptional regulator
MKEKEEFSRHFREVQPKFARLCLRSLSQAKLTMPQFALLNVLASADSMPMTDLSDKLHITKPAVTNLVDRLEKNKYIKRLSHPEDRRIHLIRIEPKGRKLVQGMQSTILGFLLEALESFDVSERKTVTQFYARLSETMDQFLSKKKS